MTIERFAVFGHPITHSLSPHIYKAFAEQTGIAMEYTAIDAPAPDFPALLERFAAEGGRGVNLTLPLKEIAFGLCSRTGPRAQFAKAVNTLKCEDDGWYGDNTDGSGLIRDLTGRQLLDLRGRRTLLLGAGGAAHGIAPVLLDAGVLELVIVNRTPARADALMDALGDPARAHSRYWDDLDSQGDFELIINATSAGRGEGVEFDLPLGLCNRMTLAVDLNYGEAAIPFLAWARSAECRNVVDGLGMLVEQAADSFELWHGVRPETDPVYDILRQHNALLVTVD
ncbi:MAG: shikimate dehydrogenase [Xanthomonadaceae bacterium]|nr:shikimate dehydrogenase [Xanthomonadaceae bacterium]